jgi:hypothetical protein
VLHNGTAREDAMPSLDDFVRRHILSLTSERAPMPRPAQCMIVTRVAPGSIAARAGISPKDFLAQMDGEPASKLVPELYVFHAPKHTYVFYARSRHESVVLVTDGIDIGVELAFTPDAIRASYDPKAPNYKALESLWEARDHKTLETLAGDTLARGARDSPALVYKGAALYEAGRHDEAMPLIHEYVQQFASHWTMNFTAVGLYYLGQDAIRQGQSEKGLGLLQTAFDYNSFDRIALAIEKQTGARPAAAPPRFKGKRFPINYDLPLLESAPPGRVSLFQTLTEMPPEKWLILCLLDGYRGNGPYNAFMLRYLGWGEHFAPFFHDLHVITEKHERPVQYPQYFRAEDQARKARLPFSLLHDERGLLSAAIEPSGSPHMLVLERSGTIVYEGEMESADLWGLLAGP